MLLMNPSRFAASGGGGSSRPSGDANFSSVVLLTTFGGGDGGTDWTDDSNEAHTLTLVGDAQTDTGITQFSQPSALFDGAGDYAYFSDTANMAMGTGDFTFEGWMQKPDWDGGGTYNTLLSQYDTGVGKRSFDITWRAGINRWEIFANLSSTDNSFTDLHIVSDTLSDGTWHHWVWERSGSDFRFYRDGTMLNKRAGFSSSALRDVDIDWVIGMNADKASDPFLGSLFDIRVTKGVARYNSDSGYTVPTDWFPGST